MRTAVERQSEAAEKVVRDIRRATRRQYTAEEKVRIVIAGLRGEDSIAELCRKEGINQNLYYRWSKEFLEAGKNGWPATRPARPPAMKSKACGWRLSS
jgi:transposase